MVSVAAFPIEYKTYLQALPYSDHRSEGPKRLDH